MDRLDRFHAHKAIVSYRTRSDPVLLDADWPHIVVIPFSDALARAAGRLADTHSLRGGDAVHLASFEELVSRCADDDLRFSAADVRLVRAARSLG